MKYRIYEEKDIPESDAYLTKKLKAKKRRTVLSSSLNAEKKLYPDGAEVYTNPANNKERTSLADFPRNASKNYEGKEKPRPIIEIER